VVRFEGGLTETQKNAFKAAADRWSRVIVGDLPAVSIGGEVIDDLLISARGAAIDGILGTLGRAGPTQLRPRSAGAFAFLPAMGMMEFDTADLANMEAGDVRAVIPTALTSDRFCPLAPGDRGEPFWHGHEGVPGPAAGVDDGLIVGPDA
jgi:hypothetical protein